MSEQRKNIGDWYKSLSPEEQRAHIDQLQAKRRAKLEEKKKLRMSAEEKAKELLPELIAKDYIRSADWRPSDNMLQKLRELVGKGYSIDDMRNGPFRDLDEKTWSSVIKHLFKDQVGQIEALGISLLQSRKEALARCKKRARMIKKEMRVFKTQGKPVPPKYFTELGAVEDKQHAIEVELMKTLHHVEAVGEKSKAASITMNFSTPRPKPSEAAIDVTPK